MAKEHIYTRGNEGFFTHAEGYDTFAISKGLTEEYIKQNIYPLCFYEKSKGTDIMPDVYYYKYIQNPEFDTDAVIFGKNSYICASRNYILCRSLIVYEENELKLLNRNFEEFIEFDNYSKLPVNPSFLEDINISDYFKPYNILLEREFIFSLLEIDKNKYKCLLYSILQSIVEKETIYIKLNCKPEFCSRYAKKLLKLLFVNIPADLKRQLSYITYSPTADLKTFFNIVFFDIDFDMETIKDMGIRFDFLANNKFYLDDKSSFLTFAWINILCGNKILLNSELYKRKYLLNNLLYQLDKMTIEVLEFYKYKFDNINENTRFSLIEYINTINSFFDLRQFYKSSAEEWIYKISIVSALHKSQLGNILSLDLNILLDTLEFLTIKTPPKNKNLFSASLYSYYNLDFNEQLKLIADKINDITHFEDFIVIAFFYLNHIEGMVRQEVFDLFVDTIEKKLICFERRNDIRKENINDLSVHLWKRYRDWI